MIINSFLGITNTSPPRSIPNNALVDAVDVFIDDIGAVVQRDGYTQGLTFPIEASYETLDNVVYVVSNGVLCRLNSDLSSTPICQSTATEFCDFSRFLFTNDGWVIHANTVSNIAIPCPIREPEVVITAGNKPKGIYTIVYTYVSADGVEGGTSPSVTVNLGSTGDILVNPEPLPGYTTQVYMTDADGEVLYLRNTRYPIKAALVNVDRFPLKADKIEYYREQLYVSVPFGDYSLIYFSITNHYHLFGYDDKRLIIPGYVEAMKSVDGGLIIATNKEIYLYDGLNLNKLASYGVVSGRPIVKQPDGTVLIYTTRGVCAALPFTPLTEKQVSLPTGRQCSTAIMYKQGTRQFIAMHDDSGSSFNKA